MGIERFPRQKEYHQKDSTGSTRPGIQLSCRVAASHSWNIFHSDLKTAFLQGQSDGVHRDVVCKLPPEANHPSYIAARLKKRAYGMNDAPRRWWNILDKALCSYVLYSTVDRSRCNMVRKEADGDCATPLFGLCE